MTDVGAHANRRVEQWERRSEWPMAAAAVIFLFAFAFPILHPTVAPAARHALAIIDYVLWAIFVAEFAWRVRLAVPRTRYFWRHSPELLTLALPVLRPLRLLRLVLLLRVIDRRAADSLRGRVLAYIVVGTGLIVFCASLAVLDAERGHSGANIESFADAAWWSATTISTVGYGDRYPVTVEGRLVAVALMLAGIGLLGTVTASLATWLVDRVRIVEVEAADAVKDELHALREQITELRAALSMVSVAAPGGQSSQATPSPSRSRPER